MTAPSAAASLTAVPYHGGYPFLALARRHGVDYSDVLRAANYVNLDAITMARSNRPLLPELVWEEIYRLLDQPVAERGQ